MFSQLVGISVLLNQSIRAVTGQTS